MAGHALVVDWSALLLPCEKHLGSSLGISNLSCSMPAWNSHLSFCDLLLVIGGVDSRRKLGSRRTNLPALSFTTLPVSSLSSPFFFLFFTPGTTFLPCTMPYGEGAGVGQWAGGQGIPHASLPLGGGHEPALLLLLSVCNV